jgi:uncharacterized protein
MWIDLFLAMWDVLGHLAPWILLGTLIAGLMHILLPRDFIRRSFRGTGGVFRAVGLGVPLPLCSCGVIPAGIGLKKDGASNGAAIGFLISTPQVGVTSMLVSASFLGWPFALFKVFSAAVTGVVGGLLVERFVGHGPQMDESEAEEIQASGRRGIRDMLAHGLDIIRSIWHWLLIGVVVSAVIDVLVPESVFAQLRTWSSLSSALAALVISLPLYVCATSSVPIAAVLVAGGLPPSAALVFLMAGPATNVATIGAIHRRFGTATTSIYLVTIIVGSILFAVSFDWLVTATPLEMPDCHGHGLAPWNIASALVLLALIAWFAIDDVRRRWSSRPAGATGELSEWRVAVQGMNCNNCVVRWRKSCGQPEGSLGPRSRSNPAKRSSEAAWTGNRLSKSSSQRGFRPTSVFRTLGSSAYASSHIQPAQDHPTPKPISMLFTPGRSVPWRRSSSIRIGSVQDTVLPQSFRRSGIRVPSIPSRWYKCSSIFLVA